MDTYKLKSARASMGYTQVEMAKKLFITQKTYNRKELGKVDFSLKEVTGIIDILKLDVENVYEIFFNKKITKCIACEVSKNT
ncbi:MAG: helix-turn-helix domain-containing protein [Vallitalea sp.]|jgi:DNA-binding XRE family transcriptional regulator|nr:helix-turn-helix domain-containing protein [Vallitalea sp.]